VRLPAEIISAVLPTRAGQMEILLGHLLLLVLLGTGVLSFLTEGKKIDLMVSGGFAEVADDTVRVMTELASLAEEVDKSAEQKALTKFQKELAGLGPVVSDDDNFARLQAETERVVAKLNLLQ
jgi:F-type H+-transporting ATPase subunit epsilon